MDYRVKEDDFGKLSQKELEILRSKLLATVYQQTLMQLELFQRGQRLNSSGTAAGQTGGATRAIATSSSHTTTSPQGSHRKYSQSISPNAAPAIPYQARGSNATSSTTTTKTTPTMADKKRNSIGGNQYVRVRRNGKQNGYDDGNDDHILSEKMLNAIKLEQELDALRRIYKIAMEALMEPPSLPCQQDDSEDEQDSELEKPEAEGKDAQFREVIQLNKKRGDRLQNAIEAQKVNHNEDEMLKQQLQDGHCEMRQLKYQLQTERQIFDRKMLEKSEQIATLKHNLRHVRRVNELEYSLVERWEETRFAQAKMVGENAERSLLKEILDYKRRLAGEERIIREIRRFRQFEFEDLRHQIDDWQTKFKNEIDSMDLKVQDQERQMVDLLKSEEKHKEIYEERVQFVEEYLEKKAEEERIIQMQRHRVACAVKIQAWWRGTMVRKGLGPYKKKPKKGKKVKAKT